MPACDRQTEGQTSCHGIVRAMHTRRAVKMALFMRTRRQTQPNVTYQIIAKNFENGRNEYNSDVVFRAASGKKKHVTNCRHLHDFRRNVPANLLSSIHSDSPYYAREAVKRREAGKQEWTAS